MIALRTWLTLGGALALIPAVLMSSDYATLAADHVEPPTRADPTVDPIPDAAADLADIFAWHTPQSVVIMITFAGPRAANLPPVYDRDVLYRINISNAGASTDAEHQILVRFGFDGNAVGVQISGVPGTTGPIIGPVQTELNKEGVRAIAGIFDDPFFFDSQGLKDTRATGTLSIRNTRDFFANGNDTMVILEIPRASIMNGSNRLDIWSDTGRFGGQI
ncbi:hypothetical protein [Sphingomonas sp.]|jgi:hypothetical protein|uniref:hypothetical protein n=1 Tax=Sphingomonas sp. TaxID=28214 RepID=UPI002DECB8F1|nr:hypothetical protein [Sphingomonas sp.]